jgi:Ca-activated chloride channel family protein
MSKTLGIVFVLGLCAWIAAGDATLVARQRQGTFRSSVDLVTIQASVRDARGRILRGLTGEDFEVRDNGQLKPVISVRAGNSPVSIAILVDTSGSMQVASKTSMARQTLEALLSRLREGQDEAALLAFDAELHELQDFTGNLSALRSALSRLEPFGTTSLYDAAAATARRLADRSATNRAIIVLTDGVDTSSRLTAPEVSGLAASIDVPVYVIATVPSIDQRQMVDEADQSPRSGAADLRDLARWTGGQLTFANNSAEASAAVGTIIDELRQQYVLAIEAASARGWRRLEVRARNPRAIVKARGGYFGG